jgi:hypothetical protein
MMTVHVTAPWDPLPIRFFCTEECRSAEHLIRALAQLNIECNHRYDQNQQGHGETYCNIAAWDGTSALQCAIPACVDSTGRSCPVTSPGHHELSALGQIQWLRVYGSEHGWYECTRHEALDRLSKGYPVAATWENPATLADGRRASSHIALGLPPLAPDEMRICQAGANNLWDVVLEDPRCFEHLGPIQYWTHQ